MDYSPLEKSAVSLACLPCVALLVGIYFFAKRSLLGDKKDTITRRMELWYAAMSGGMLGIFMFRTLPQSAGIASSVPHDSGWSYRTLSAFVMLGFYALMWVDKYGRVWAYNSELYAGLTREEATEHDELHYIVDNEAMEVTSYHECSDVRSNAYPEQLHVLRVESHVLFRRRFHAILLLALMVFICVVEGLYMVYRQDDAPMGRAGLIASFYVDKVLETIVVASIFIYGMFHSSKRGYLVLSAVWVITVILSTVAVLNSTPTPLISEALHHPALGIFYAISAGLVFYISIYFISYNRAYTDTCEMVARMVVFGAGLWTSFLTGMFM